MMGVFNVGPWREAHFVKKEVGNYCWAVRE